MTDQTNLSDENGRKSTSFNPLAWGILFFSFWISLQMIDELPPFQQHMGWFFLGLSAALFLSIFCPWLQKLWIKPSVSGFFLPLIFFVSLLGFAISVASSLSNLEGISRAISVFGGVLWFIAYFLVLARVAAELGRRGFWASIVICSALIGNGIYVALTSNVVVGTILVALGIISIVIVIKKLPIWHKFPFV